MLNLLAIKQSTVHINYGTTVLFPLQFVHLVPDKEVLLCEMSHNNSLSEPPHTTGRIQFKVLTTLLMTLSSFLLEYKGF